MKTVLVSGASGIVGYGCLKSLRQTSLYRLIGTSIYDSDVAKKFSDIFVMVPHTDDEIYLSRLKDVITNYKVDILIPGIEIDMYKWNSNRALIESWGTKLLLNSKELVDVCNDKWIFFQRLKQVDDSLCIPTYINKNFSEVQKEIGENIILKPRRGYGAKGIRKINGEREFDFYMAKEADSLMIQKEIHGEEYTVGAFYDAQSNLCTYISLKRKLSSAGYTEYAETVDLIGINDVIGKLGKAFKAQGPTNFQFISDKGELKLLEINPRISSSTYIRAQFGYNECAMGVEFLSDNIIPHDVRTRRGRVTRYIEELVEYDRNNVGYSREL